MKPRGRQYVRISKGRLMQRFVRGLLEVDATWATQGAEWACAQVWAVQSGRAFLAGNCYIRGGEDGLLLTGVAACADEGTLCACQCPPLSNFLSLLGMRRTPAADGLGSLSPRHASDSSAPTRAGSDDVCMMCPAPRCLTSGITACKPFKQHCEWASVRR